MNARDIALEALQRCRTGGAWSDGAIREAIGKSGADTRDASLATGLFYSVVQNRLLLDYYLEQFVKGGLKKLHPFTLDILRIALCQLLFFDRIPASAAVNEAVKQTKQRVNPGAAGLVNGVLRAIVRQKGSLPQPDSLSVRYSCPEPLTELLRQAVGEKQLEPLLQAQNEAPEITVMVNTLKTDMDTLQAALSEEGVASEPHPWLSDCLVLQGTGNLTDLSAYRDGLFFVQDPASALAVRSADIQPGMRVLDCCAAPGGKSFSAALQMKNSGFLSSGDLHPHKIKLLEAGAERLGITILSAAQRDASQPKPEWNNQFDRVLCDVPCSGLGVIRKKPDIRYKDISELSNLPAIQTRILETQSAFVRPGGCLLYSTCTIVPAENAAVVDAFLQKHPEFVEVRPVLPVSVAEERGITLLPHIHGTDGFYFCLLHKKQ